MIIAENIGRPLDPDAVWEKFFSNQPKESEGGVFISDVLDIAREYGIANRMDFTRDIARAASASASTSIDATGPTNVVGVLMATEFAPNLSDGGFSRNPHLWVVRQILEDIQTKQILLETESASRGEESRVYTLPDAAFEKILRTFLILLK